MEHIYLRDERLAGNKSLAHYPQRGTAKYCSAVMCKNDLTDEGKQGAHRAKIGGPGLAGQV